MAAAGLALANAKDSHRIHLFMTLKVLARKLDFSLVI